MNVIVRLYWQHDLDLVALTLHPSSIVKSPQNNNRTGSSLTLP